MCASISKFSWSVLQWQLAVIGGEVLSTHFQVSFANLLRCIWNDIKLLLVEQKPYAYRVAVFYCYQSVLNPQPFFWEKNEGLCQFAAQYLPLSNPTCIFNKGIKLMYQAHIAYNNMCNKWPSTIKDKFEGVCITNETTCSTARTISTQVSVYKLPLKPSLHRMIIQRSNVSINYLHKELSSYNLVIN